MLCASALVSGNSKKREATSSFIKSLLVVIGLLLYFITNYLSRYTSINFAFGRRAYQSANRVIMSIQLIPAAVGVSIMIALIDAGKGLLGYWILLAIVLFGIATTIPMFMMKDANAADRR